MEDDDFLLKPEEEELFPPPMFMDEEEEEIRIPLPKAPKEPKAKKPKLNQFHNEVQLGNCQSLQPKGLDVGPKAVQNSVHLHQGFWLENPDHQKEAQLWVPKVVDFSVDFSKFAKMKELKKSSTNLPDEFASFSELPLSPKTLEVETEILRMQNQTRQFQPERVEKTAHWFS